MTDVAYTPRSQASEAAGLETETDMATSPSKSTNAQSSEASSVNVAMTGGAGGGGWGWSDGLEGSDGVDGVDGSGRTGVRTGRDDEKGRDGEGKRTGKSASSAVVVMRMKIILIFLARHVDSLWDGEWDPLAWKGSLSANENHSHTMAQTTPRNGECQPPDRFEERRRR